MFSLLKRSTCGSSTNIHRSNYLLLTDKCENLALADDNTSMHRWQRQGYKSVQKVCEKTDSSWNVCNRIILHVLQTAFVENSNRDLHTTFSSGKNSQIFPQISNPPLHFTKRLWCDKNCLQKKAPYNPC